MPQVDAYAVQYRKQTSVASRSHSLVLTNTLLSVLPLAWTPTLSSQQSHQTVMNHYTHYLPQEKLCWQLKIVKSCSPAETAVLRATLIVDSGTESRCRGDKHVLGWVEADSAKYELLWNLLEPARMALGFVSLVLVRWSKKRNTWYSFQAFIMKNINSKWTRWRQVSDVAGQVLYKSSVQRTTTQEWVCLLLTATKVTAAHSLTDWRTAHSHAPSNDDDSDDDDDNNRDTWTFNDIIGVCNVCMEGTDVEYLTTSLYYRTTFFFYLQRVVR